MAQRNRGPYGNPGARVPQLLVSISCSLVAFTGMWLWWFGQDIDDLIIRENDITDPFAAQVWMRRLHVYGGYVIVALILFILLQAVMRGDGLRALFLITFLLLAIVAIWTGLDADWNAARLWSETIGTKLSAGIDIGGDRRLPDDLRVARSHLSVVPAAMLVVALLSFWQYRRS